VKKTLLVAMLGIAGMLTATGALSAQVAGATTVGIAVAEMQDVLVGWSAKKSILGKTVYNENGDKVGKVDDLIIASDKNVSYLIVGAGGFVGIGRHDVAIPIKQVQEKDGKIVLPGATKEIVKSLPRFEYAKDTAKRDQFVAAAEKEITIARVKIAALEKKGLEATDEAKAKLYQQIVALKQDAKIADQKIAEMRQAAAMKWKVLEREVNDALARLHQTLEKSASSGVRVRRTFLASNREIAPCLTLPLSPINSKRSNRPWLERRSSITLTKLVL
jgi:sporulation protein YlmC with PRC-barrel domain